MKNNYRFLKLEGTGDLPYQPTYSQIPPTKLSLWKTSQKELLFVNMRKLFEYHFQVSS